MAQVIETITSNENKIDLARQFAAVLQKYSIKYTPEAIGRILDRWQLNKKYLFSKLQSCPGYDPDNLCIYVPKFRSQKLTDKLRTFWKFFKCQLKSDTPQFAGVLQVLETSINRSLETNTRFTLVKDEYRALVALNNTLNLCDKNVSCEARLISVLNWLDRSHCEHTAFEDIKGYGIIRNLLSLLGSKPVSYVISAHPCDYLLMSNGNSWSSCHKLAGVYASGTISHMLDNVSLVAYAIPCNAEAPYHMVPKISRSLIFLDEACVTVPKVYPINDSDFLETYTDLVSSVFGYDSISDTDCIDIKSSRGATNYPDYDHSWGRQRLSADLPAEMLANKTVSVGHAPLCVYCGEVSKRSDKLYCMDAECESRTLRCMNCHKAIEAKINGVAICAECIVTCDICGDKMYRNITNDTENALQEDGTYIEHLQACSRCRSRELYRCSYCDQFKYRGEILKTQAFNRGGYLHHTRYNCMSCLAKELDQREKEGNFTYIQELAPSARATRAIQ